jgi:cytidylate kinase
MSNFRIGAVDFGDIIEQMRTAHGQDDDAQLSSTDRQAALSEARETQRQLDAAEVDRHHQHIADELEARGAAAAAARDAMTPEQLAQEGRDAAMRVRIF